MLRSPLSPSPNEEPLPLERAYDAIRRVIQVVDGTETVPLSAAADRVIPVAIRSRLALPPFDHSAVDGYGITVDDLPTSERRLTIMGRAVAGSAFKGPAVTGGQSVYLATGAPVPDGIVAIAMHEKTTLSGSVVDIHDGYVEGDNIRRAGEDVSMGAEIVSANTLSDYRHIAILASTGIGEIAVRRRIRVGLVSTGDEVRPQSVELLPGEIYDVNGPMLGALLDRAFIESSRLDHVADDKSRLTEAIGQAASDFDVLVSTGGAAGSDTDHIQAAITGAGGRSTHLRLALRPGKPIIVGRVSRCLVLGLPGNPLAALANFLLFARPAILATAGMPLLRPRGQWVITAHDLPHKQGRSEFAPARIVDHTADGRAIIEKVGRGGSARLRPLVQSEGFIEIDAELGDVPAGRPIQFHPFNASFGP